MNRRTALSENFILVTGRTIRQASGMHKGKYTDKYRRAVTVVEMNAEDMARLGIAEGRLVRLHTPTGQVEAPVHAGSLPPKMVFIPMGPVANELVGPETDGTGMPTFKGLTVEVEPA
jgi:formylmethanofuran dehydrogenase subunit D